MGDALLELEWAEVPQVNAAFGKSFVEADHCRLVFRPNRANRNRGAALEFPVGDVLRRVRPNREFRQLFLASFRIMQDDARIQGYQVLAGSEKRIDIDFFDPTL